MRRDEIVGDINFKKALGNKFIMSYVLKYLISEFAELSLPDIARCIAGESNGTSDEAVMNSLIELKNADMLLKDTERRMDLLFDALVPNTNKKDIILTFDMEMQNDVYPTEKIFQPDKEQKEVKSYSLLVRSIYYLSVILTNMTNRDIFGYSDIHKIYGIWFCNGSAFGRRNKSIDGNEKPFIRRLGIREFFQDETLEEKCAYIKEADIFEIIFIDLKMALKQYEKAKKENQEVNPMHEMIYHIFGIKGNIKEVVEQQSGVKLTNPKIKEEVNTMSAIAEVIRELSMERGMERGIEQGIEQGMEQGIVIGRKEQLFYMVYKKAKKGKTICEIAEELEEKEEFIAEMYEKINTFSGDDWLEAWNYYNHTNTK